jgi:hypothetical protein
MSSSSDRSSGQFSTPKRRKIRKGTQSCWECKRRKIRCTFATPSESVCDGCRSRRVKCLGQEYHDDTKLAPASDKRGSNLDKIVCFLPSFSITSSRLTPSSAAKLMVHMVLNLLPLILAVHRSIRLMTMMEFHSNFLQHGRASMSLRPYQPQTSAMLSCYSTASHACHTRNS